MATIANPLAGLFSSPPPPAGVAAPASSDNGNGSDNSGWLSGLGDLFSGIGTVVVAGIHASNTPASPVVGSGWVFDPSTGLYRNAQGQYLTATGQAPSAVGVGTSIFNNPIVLIIIAIVGFLLLRKKA